MSDRKAIRANIEDFYAQKRLAVVGVSRNEKEYSRLVFRELKQRGYQVIPVNPNAAELDGVPCYAQVADVAGQVDGALVLLAAEGSAQAARECAESGIKRVWLRNDVPEAREVCERRGVTLVAGYCPFMFMPGSNFLHQCHGFALKLIGKYPN